MRRKIVAFGVILLLLLLNLIPLSGKTNLHCAKNIIEIPKKIRKIINTHQKGNLDGNVQISFGGGNNVHPQISRDGNNQYDAV